MTLGVTQWICCYAFVNRLVISSQNICYGKSLWCGQFTVVSLFGPSNFGLWISSGITEQDQPTSFYNLISWWGMVNIRGDCRDKYHGCYLRFDSSMIARTSYVLFCKATCKNSHLPYTPKISSREYIIFLYTAFHVFSDSKRTEFHSKFVFFNHPLFIPLLCRCICFQN